MTTSFGGKKVSDYTDDLLSGELTAEKMNAKHSELLEQVRQGLASAPGLSDHDRAAAAAKVTAMEAVIETSGLDDFAQTMIPESADATTPAAAVADFFDDEQAVATELIDEEENARRRAQEEAERRATFAAEEAKSRQETTSDYAPESTAALLAEEDEDPGEDTGSESAPDGEGTQDDPPWEVDDPSDDESTDNDAEPDTEQRTPIVPPEPPAIPAVDTSSGPLDAPPPPVTPPPPGPGYQPPGGLDYLTDNTDDLDIKPAPSPFSGVLDKIRPAWEKITSWKLTGAIARWISSWPKSVRIIVALLLVMGLLIGLLGRGGEDETPAPAPQGEVVTNPEENKPLADDDLIELHPSGGVGSKCEVRANEAARAFSKTKGDGWVCPRTSPVDGAYMAVDFGHEVEVSAIEFIPGLWNPRPSGGNDWYTHRLIAQLKVLAPPGAQQPAPITVKNPSQNPVRVTFDKPFKATRINLVVQATIRPEDPYKGTSQALVTDEVDRSFAMSGLRILGKDPQRR